jgi:hypothetical protein
MRRLRHDHDVRHAEGHHAVGSERRQLDGSFRCSAHVSPAESTGRLRWYLLAYSVVVTVYLVLALDDAVRSALGRGLVEVVYHAMSRTASVGTALAAVIVGFEGVTMTFLKSEREKGRREGRLEGMRERDREWKDWQERLKKDPKAEPPRPPKDQG